MFPVHKVVDLLRKGGVIDCGLLSHCICLHDFGFINTAALLIRVMWVRDAQFDMVLAWLEFGAAWFSVGSNDIHFLEKLMQCGQYRAFRREMCW